MAAIIPAPHLPLAPLGALGIRGDDVYAVIGLVAGLALLFLWVLIENLRLTRRRNWNTTALPTAVQRPAAHQDMRQDTRPTVSAQTPAEMAPVPARTEWLLDDNTLLRMGVVQRNPVRRPASAQPEPHPAPPEESSLGRMRASRPLRIAVMGSRGILANHGAFESFVEQFATRLVERGHAVTVYCRAGKSAWPAKTYRGVRLVKIPASGTAYTLLSLLHGEFRGYDLVYLCGVDNGPLAALPRLAGKPTVLNVERLHGERGGPRSERMAARRATCLVTDTQAAGRYFQERYHASSVFIPGGTAATRRPPGETLARLGLTPDGYILALGRPGPDGEGREVIAAYQRLGGLATTGLRLCLVGDGLASGSGSSAGGADPGVVFAGNVSRDDYAELGSNALLVAFTGDGTHPALLEAMALGNCLVVKDMAATTKIVGESALSYSATNGADDLARVIAQAISDPALLAESRRRAAQRAASVYRWDECIDRYEALFSQLARAT